MTKEELAKQINGAAVCCCIMETVLKAGKKLWTVPNYLASQAREAQRKAQVRKDLGKDKERKMVSMEKMQVCLLWEATGGWLVCPCKPGWFQALALFLNSITF